MGLENLKNLSPSGLHKINSPSDSIVNGRHGGIETSPFGAQPPHQVDHSTLDDVGNLTYHKSNTYEDRMHGLGDGNLSSNSDFNGLNSIGNSDVTTNTNELLNIRNTPFSNDDNEKIYDTLNFDYREFRIGSPTHGLYGFTHTVNLYPGSTIDDISFPYSRYESNITNPLFDYDSTTYRTSGYDDPSSPTDTVNVPGFENLVTGNSTIPLFNSENNYQGSNLDELLNIRNTPFSNDDNEKIYNTLNFDYRQFREGVPTTGNYGHESNVYEHKGSKLDNSSYHNTPSNSNPIGIKDLFSVDYTAYSPNISFGYNDGAFKPAKSLEDQNQFNTLYNHDHTSKMDVTGLSLNFNRDKLKLRDGGYNPFVGWRGNEPYIISDIPEEQGIKGGRFTNLGGRIFPMMRGITDALRITSFIGSGKGLEFLGKQFLLQSLNPRVKRIYNPLSLFSGIPLGANVKFRMDRGWLFSPQDYKHTLWEGNPSLGSPPNWVDNLIATATNSIGQKFGTLFVGGNAFQVLGKNKEGKTDISNVSPVPRSSTLILPKVNFESNVSEQPRKVGQGNSPEEYTKKINDIASKTSEKLSIDAQVTLLNTDPTAGSDDSTQAELYDLNVKSEKLKNEIKGLQGLVDTKFGPKYYKYENIPDNSFNGRTYIGNGVSKLGDGSIIEGNYYPDSMDTRTTQKGSNKKIGDIMTVMDISSGATLKEAHPNDNGEIEKSESGFPLYFKDLRDNSYIVFRGYVYGLNENISSNWSSQVYLGRSEPVFGYEHATRDINFTLKLAPQSFSEFKMIYKKLNKLTSMCYPQYKKDEKNFRGDKNRLRPVPPLTKLRMAELYGTKDNELNGFLKTLTYTYQTEALWEDIQGSRAPKFIDVMINYQVIHDQTPNLDTNFYGVTS